MKKFFCFLLCICLLLCAGCGQEKQQVENNSSDSGIYGENYRSDMALPEKGHLYGMCYLAYEGLGNGIDYVKAFELMHNLGVQSIRHWMHFSYYMKDYKTFKSEAVEQMHAMLAEAAKYNFQIIGMNHTNWSVKDQRFTTGKPVRKPWDEDYQTWLNCYEESWYLAVKEFPEITYWEIDNEINNKDFMYTQGHFGEKLSTKEMAALAADMLYYGSRGIHRANPKAVTVMGGIVDPMGLGIPMSEIGTTMVNFMEALYDEIESGDHHSYYPDDFFQVAAWHPYYYKKEADSYFVEQNNAIYDVIRKREGKDKKVFLTEFGWNEKTWSIDKITEAMKNLYKVVAEQMPYVESLHYFRAFDNSANNSTYGIFYDPNPERKDIGPDGTRRTPGAAKPTAYAYQEAAGGKGSLTLLETPLLTESVKSDQMVRAAIEKNLGKVEGTNFDYELLMGDAEGTLTSFPHAIKTKEKERVQNVAEGTDPQCFISTWQIRGGTAESGTSAVFRITAKENIKFTISFQAKSDWAAGFFRTLLIHGGSTKEINRTDVQAGTKDSMVVVNPTVEANMQAGDVLLFYFGNETTDVQTLRFYASFTADPSN